MVEKTKTPITIIGLDRAGKSVITNYLATGILVKDIRPTLSLDYGSIILHSLKCPFYDTPGQKSLRSMWGKVLDVASFIIFTIDTGDVSRYIEALDEFTNIMQKENLKKVPLIILFHKIDLPHAREHLDELKAYFSPDFINSFGEREFAYFETTIEDVSTLDAVKEYLYQHVSELTHACAICEDIS
jgi:small GTP-binding protein